MKKGEKLDKQLAALSGAVNAFKSEAVQAKVIDWLMHYLDGDDQEDPERSHLEYAEKQKSPPDAPVSYQSTEDKVSPTRILRELIRSGFFENPKTLTELVNHCRQHHHKDVNSRNFSGILTLTTRKNILVRDLHAQTKQFQYALPVSCIN